MKYEHIQNFLFRKLLQIYLIIWWLVSIFMYDIPDNLQHKMLMYLHVNNKMRKFYLGVSVKILPYSPVI